MEESTIEDIKKNVAKKVLYYRKIKGLSQSDLCYSAEIDISTLSRIERCQLNGTLETYIKICQVLEIELHLIFMT